MSRIPRVAKYLGLGSWGGFSCCLQVQAVVKFSMSKRSACGREWEDADALEHLDACDSNRRRIGMDLMVLSVSATAIGRGLLRPVVGTESVTGRCHRSFSST
jgi:hypothetical protein